MSRSSAAKVARWLVGKERRDEAVALLCSWAANGPNDKDGQELLVKYKDGDANVRSVWLCSRNDAIGNVAVMLAALGVWSTATGWPDVIVAAILASLFLNSASKILRQALGEWRVAKNAHPLTSALADYER
jgi:Co/Zn/Cd efflux system component